MSNIAPVQMLEYIYENEVHTSEGIHLKKGDLGNIILPTGCIAAIDPFLNDKYINPFVLKVEPGKYPVQHLLVQNQAYTTAALGTILFNNNKAIKWKPAATNIVSIAEKRNDENDIASLSIEYDCSHHDLGIMDIRAANYVRKLSEFELADFTGDCLYDQIITNRADDRMSCIHKVTKTANMVVFPYEPWQEENRFFFGFDEFDNPCNLTVDLGVISDVFYLDANNLQRRYNKIKDEISIIQEHCDIIDVSVKQDYHDPFKRNAYKKLNNKYKDLNRIASMLHTSVSAKIKIQQRSTKNPAPEKG